MWRDEHQDDVLDPEMTERLQKELEDEYRWAVEDHGPKGRSRRKKKGPHGEWGAALCLALVSIVVGGTALAMILTAPSTQPTLPAGPATTLPGGELPSVEEWEEDMSVGLPTAPTGDGTRLHLADRPQEGELTFQEIYSQVNPAVVTIQAGSMMSGSEGTGVIMSQDGYIITNQHVIDGASWADVVLSDGTYYEASLVGQDVATDLAVLKIEATGLPVAPFGNSDEMLVGDVVVAIGNPLGSELSGTMTDGIISAINRSVNVDTYSMTLLQTSAALNTGNSGGALVNVYGQVIGITNMKMMSNDASQNVLEGLGFAIPTVTTKQIVDDLIAQGKITGRPTLGITVQGMYDIELVQSQVDQGLWVRELQEKSQAIQVLEVGDILVTADTIPLHTVEDLQSIKDAKRAGDTITFSVKRGEEWLTVDVELMEQYEILG